MTDTAALELVQISKSFGSSVAVREVSLRVEKGEFLSLLGPSGCGKTTTLSMIAGFERASSGRILLQGKDVTNLPPEKRDAGMAFQSYALFPHLNVAGNIGFGLRMRGCAKGEIDKRTRQIAELVRIDHLLDRQPRQLSGGQQQRVALARALVVEPSILLLDEPFGALDRQLRESLQIELKTLLRRLGMTTVFVTHDQDEALSMSDRIAVMNSGRIEQVDTPKMLYDKPESRFVAGFIGKANFISGHLRKDSQGIWQVQAACGSIALPTQNLQAGTSEVNYFVRPEAVKVLDQGEASDNRFSAIVVETAYFGDHEQVLLELEGGIRMFAVLDHRRTQRAPSVGDKVEAGWPQSAGALFGDTERIDRAP